VLDEKGAQWDRTNLVPVDVARVKHKFSIFWLVVAGGCVGQMLGAPGGSARKDFSTRVPQSLDRLANVAVNVTQHHNNASRDGLYIDPAFTPARAASLARDLNFTGTVVGNIYAQPLYIEDGPGGAAMVIAVTESNNVYALNAANGSIIWQRNVGTPVALANLPCGNINPLGITGTPVVDLASRSLFLDAMTTPDGGTTKKHLIFSLNVDTGATNAGWPIDVAATAVSGSTTFTSSVHNERAALGLVNNVLYVPYSGHFGDCGSYHGWLVGVPINNPATVTAWATTATGGGIWGHGGVASDGTNLFVVTGNTFSTGGVWKGGEAVIRLQAGPVFSNTTTDYWAPTNWLALDNGDTDLGGCGALLIDVPGATPSQLVLALGKDRNAYLLNRNSLGGITAAVTAATVSSAVVRGQAAATYKTSLGTYFVFRASSTTLSAFKINPANPPTITSAWSVSQSGLGSPFVTSTDGTNNVIVWVVGSEGDQRLHGYNGDTGAVVYAGGGANELMTGTRKWNTGIAARGRIYLASDNKIYAFSVPLAPITLTNIGFQLDASFQFSFTNVPGMNFTVYSSTDLLVPVANWTRVGNAQEVSPGQFQFNDPAALSNPAKFYRVTSP
jgi:hypothetical protein